MRVRAVLVAAAVLSGALPAAAGHAGLQGGDARGPVGGGVSVVTTDGPGSCSRAEAKGGDWPSLNGDLANTRHQDAEDRLRPEVAADVVAAWAFDAGSLGIPGAFRSTPVVAGGCVYVASGEGYLGARGDVVALDADTGAVVWHAQIGGSLLGLAVADGLVYATPSRGTRGEVATPTVTEGYVPAGSYAVALDARTGLLRWTSERLDDGQAVNGSFVNASPVVFGPPGRSMVFVPLSGGGGDGARVPMYFLDAQTGRTVRRALSLSEAEYREGFGGTGIWTTAAYDPVTKHLYAGTSDSDGKTKQHEYNNAVLKIDADPDRSTFATVVDAYEGISERYDVDRRAEDVHREHGVGPADPFGDNPVCQGVDPRLDPPTFFDRSAAPECLELDLDFGASPQLHRTEEGELRLTALQKSGVLHAVDPSSMAEVWRAVAGPGGAAMSSATGAVGGGGIHVGGTPNLLHRLDPGTGLPAWSSTTGLDAFAYQPLTLAAGVLWTLTDAGVLLAVDAESGVPFLHRAVALDVGRDAAGCLGAGAGVAVARSTVFVPCDGGGKDDLLGVDGDPGALVAYR